MFDKKKYHFCNIGHQYALDVISGKVVASAFLIGACNRYLRDVVNEKKDWYFEPKAAEKYLKLVQKFEHVVGHWPTNHVVYEPWQCWVWMNIMGFLMRDTKFRRFRIAHVEIARGNGKSLMASQAALYFLCLDNPNGNQISTVATKKDQARIVLDAARAMARKNSSFTKSKGVTVLKHTILHPQSNSVVRALSSEASSLDGLTDVLAVCDELHAMKRDTFEVIISGMSKRKDSLTLCITTAGQDTTSIGHAQSSFAKKVCLNEIEADNFFAAVYCLDEDDDWFDESVWIKANPNLGISVDEENIRALIKKAEVSPSDIPNIQIKHMNLWISEANAYFNQRIWDECADPTLKIEDFKNVPGIMAMDLAAKVDLTSIGMLFRKDGLYYFFEKSFLPEGTIEEIRGENSSFDEWVANGHLIATKGDAINNDFIREQMEDWIKNFRRVNECFYDKWSAVEMAQKLANKIEMVQIGMNTGNLSEPMKTLDALIREKKIRHNGSPLLRWCLGNVVAKEDHNSNVFPRKSHVKNKIDPIIVIMMALAGWLQNQPEESVYETRGIRILGG